jgi:hypothetical protein
LNHISRLAPRTRCITYTDTHGQCRLDWASCQRGRVASIEAFQKRGDEGTAQKLKGARDVLVLTLLTTMPPDRVGVVRLLRLGTTLCRTTHGWDLDLSMPGAHKTSAAFGPTRTALSAQAVKWINTYISMKNALPTPCTSFLFHQPGKPSTPLTSSQWTKFVQGVWKRYTGVPLSPKVRITIPPHTHTCRSRQSPSHTTAAHRTVALLS